MEADAEVARRTEHLPEWKEAEVEAIKKFIEAHDSLGVVNVTGIPSRQLQNMRRELQGAAHLRVSRNTLLTRAVEEVDAGIEALTPYIAGQVGLIGTDDNPFGLYRKLEASKTPAPIHAGEVAPNDIVIPAGDTGIDPGPFVGDLQQVGANARIQEGSIRVSADSTVAETGDVVSQKLSAVLSELEIEPKEVGLDLRAVYADGVLFEPDELAIDIDAYRADVRAATGAAWNLSVNAGYPTARTVEAMLQRAIGAGKGVGLRAAIEDPELLPDLISRADAQLRQLAVRIEDEEALPPELRELTEVDAPPTDPTETETKEAAPDEEPADATDDERDDDDEDAGAEGLGELFG